MKKHLWAVCFSAVLLAFTVYIALDTFVLAEKYNTNAVEMNTAMFAETDSERSAESGRENSGPAETRPEARQTQRNDSSPAASPEAAGGAGGRPGDSSGGPAADGSGGNAPRSGEMSGRGGRGDSSGEMSGPGSRRSTDSGDSTDSENSADSSSGRSGGSGRGRGSDRDGWSDGGWGGDSDRDGRSGRGNWSSAQSAEGVDASAAYSGDTTYKDENVAITLTEYNQNDTRIYVADVVVSSAQYIKTAFAEDTYGRNVTESTSAMAVAHDAILAINGDYYGAQERGFVIRNGIVYRNSSAGKDVMCIYADGTMGIVSDRETTAEQLVENGVWQAFSFGPALVVDGAVAVSRSDEVGMGMASNPRTAVGMIDANHYVFVVSDGRTDESEGLSLYELAQFLQSLGVRTAYNLDGGGSSTMYFNGQIVNNPTSTGGSIKERGVSDIVYIG